MASQLTCSEVLGASKSLSSALEGCRNDKAAFFGSAIGLRRSSVRVNAYSNSNSSRPIRAVSEKERIAKEITKVASTAAEGLKVLTAETGKAIQSIPIEEIKGTTKVVAEQLLSSAQRTSVVLSETASATASQIQSALETATNSEAIKELDAPEPIKELASTAVEAHSFEAVRKGAVIHDFCLGITYGVFLVASGFFSFLASGSLDAVRFGIIIGGLLLASSVGSLNAWKKGKSSNFYILVQTACAYSIFIREATVYAATQALLPAAAAALSIGMVLFYLYVILAGGNAPKKHVA